MPRLCVFVRPIFWSYGAISDPVRIFRQGISVSVAGRLIICTECIKTGEGK